MPALDGLLARLDDVLAWIDTSERMPQAVAAFPMAPDEKLVAPRGGVYWGGGQRLELVRFAGANRLKVAFTYDGTLRIAEPYSLRRKKTGNLILYARENGASHVKAFNTAKMYDVRTTDQPFVPRFGMELTG
jgi:hypothetical protein